jgi:predicted amidohydrolase YtcJ
MTQKKVLTKNHDKRKEGLNENGDLVYYAELLDRAHKDGLKLISTKLIQIPSKENQFTAIILARVRTNRGIFTGHGDASLTNVDPEIAPHIIRAAETRAKARALRDAVNVGVVAVEELGGKINGKTAEEEVQGLKIGNSIEDQTPQPKGEGNGQRDAALGNPDTPMTERQRVYLFRILAQRGLIGDQAHEELKKAFQVASLKEVTRTQASEMIEKLLTTFGNGEGGE